MEKNDKIGTICNFIFIIYFCIQIISFFKSFSAYYYIILSLMLMWFIFSSIRNREYYLNVKKIILYILFFGVYTFLFPILFGNAVISNRYINVFSLFFYFIVYDYNYTTNNIKNNKVIIFLIFLSTSTTFINTVKALLMNSHVSRSIKSGGDLTISLFKQNIGGYEFIYFIQILLLLILIYFFNEKNISKRILYILLFSLSLYLIVLSNYLTALLFDILIIFLLIFNHVLNNKKIIIKFFCYVMFFIACIFYKPILTNVIDVTINFTGSSYNTTRLMQLKNEINYNSDNDLYSDRIEKIKLNISQTIKYPLTGIVINEMEYNNGFLSGFGQHSFITDTFALYGIIIGIYQLFILIYPLYVFYNKYPSQRIYIIYISLDFLLILLLNNFDSLLGLVIYFMMPVFFDQIEKEPEK